MTTDASRYSAFIEALPLNRRHWTIFAVCAAGFVFDALDFQIMALVAPEIAKEWNIDPKAMGFVLSTTVVGMLLGSCLFGTISDRIGRQFGFQITVTIFALFCGLTAFAHTIGQLALLRFLTGIGIGGLVPIDTAVMSEFMPKAQRGRLMAWWALFYPVGGLLAAAAGKILVPDLGWRFLFLVGVSPAVIVLLVRFLIPESPRFLIDCGRMEEARRVIGWLAMGHQLPDSLIERQPSRSSDVKKAPPRVTVRTLFDGEYRTRTIMLWIVWFAWSFSYFGVLLWLPSLLIQYKGVAAAQVFTFVIGFMLAGVAGRVAVSFIIDRWGRCNTIAVFGVCAGLSVIVFGQQSSYQTLVAFGFLFAFFHDGGLSAIAPYTPELYPTRARATGVGYANGAGRIASVVSPVAVGYLVPFGLTPVFVMFAAGYGLAAGAVLFFGIETKGLTLEKAAHDDGDQGPAQKPYGAATAVSIDTPADLTRIITEPQRESRR